MNTPFIFGKLAYGKEFTNRTAEIKRLSANFKGGTNTILISPRRWGKSSLVVKASEQCPGQIFCFLDLYDIKSEEEFYKRLAEQVIKCSSPRWAEQMENIRKFIGKLIPSISYSPDDHQDFSFSMDWKEVMKNPEEILNLAEKIGKKKKKKIIVCIDEFQNISSFNNPTGFQKKLRASWQKHKYASYCLYGSKRHMMMEVFTSSSMPFYKFGDIIFLDKISTEDFVPFIQNRFRQTKKNISASSAEKIILSVENHPYYVQQLAQLSWLHTEKDCSEATVDECFDKLMLQLSMFFQTVTDGLTSTQVNFMKAVLNEETELSGKEMILKYNLGTSANVLRIKNTLINKEIIDFQNKTPVFLDPVYKSWLRKYYFRLKN